MKLYSVYINNGKQFIDNDVTIYLTVKENLADAEAEAREYVVEHFIDLSEPSSELTIEEISKLMGYKITLKKIIPWLERDK